MTIWNKEQTKVAFSGTLVLSGSLVGKAKVMP